MRRPRGGESLAANQPLLVNAAVYEYATMATSSLREEVTTQTTRVRCDDNGAV